VGQMQSTRKLVATFATIACLSAAASLFSDAAFAQSTQPVQSAARASMRHANDRLEHEVRLQLAYAKVDTTDVLVRAKGGKVALIGDVPEQSMISAAGEAAGKLAGVSSVDNRLVLRTIEDEAEN
jgi:hyperosmotically inducible periplasmic protein